MKEGIVAHIGDLKGHADLGEKPKSVQPIRGEVYRAKEEAGENPIRNHVHELKWQASPKGEPVPLQSIPQERQAVERREMPPPPDGENSHRFRLRRSESDPNQWVLEDPAYEVGSIQVQLHVTPDLLEESPETIQAGFKDFPVFYREFFKFLARNRKQASSEDDQR